MNKMIFKENGQNLISSRTLAERLAKKHGHVLEKIKGLVQAKGFVKACYKKRKYQLPGTNRTYYEYFMNEEGFLLLITRFRSENVKQVKDAILAAFAEAKMQTKPIECIQKTTIAEVGFIASVVAKNQELRKFVYEFCNQWCKDNKIDPAI